MCDRFCDQSNVNGTSQVHNIRLGCQASAEVTACANTVEISFDIVAVTSTHSCYYTLTHTQKYTHTVPSIALAHIRQQLICIRIFRSFELYHTHFWTASQNRFYGINETAQNVINSTLCMYSSTCVCVFVCLFDSPFLGSI